MVMVGSFVLMVQTKVMVSGSHLNRHKVLSLSSLVKGNSGNDFEVHCETSVVAFSRKPSSATLLSDCDVQLLGLLHELGSGVRRVDIHA
jgi:hypothetical protein